MKPIVLPAGTRAPAVAVALALAFAGCGGSHSTAPIVKYPPLPVGTPGNSAPDSTVLRWVAAYAAKVEPDYDSLLTSNFHYHFSAQTDPILVDQYGNGWGKVDESTSYRHQLRGFTNSQGRYVSPIVAIVADAGNLAVNADAAHADSVAWYASVSVARLNLSLDVNSEGASVTYNVSSAFAFLLVRGDAAVLSPGQDHSATRWYIRECDDLATPGPASKRGPATESPLGSTISTWGGVRALYR